MQSKQEELIKLFFKLAMGDPFLFLPDKYLKGQSTREPADLVWANNGYVVLIYLCRLKTAAKSGAHNSRQIKGWLRAWRDLGQALCGRNGHGRFSIPFSDPEYPHVIALSIIECADAIAEYHFDETKALGVTMYATVPLSAMYHLASMHASMLDVLHIMNWLRTRQTAAISEAYMLSGVTGYHLAAWRASTVESAWPSDESDPHLIANHQMLDDFLHTVSALPLEKLWSVGTAANQHGREPLSSAHVTDSLPAARLLSDLTLTEMLWLATRVQNCIDRCQARGSDPTRPPKTTPHILEHVRLHHYDVTLSAVDGDRLPRADVAVNQMLEFSRDHDRTGAHRVGPCIGLLTQKQSPSFGAAMVAIAPQPRPSATEVFLDQVRAEQYS